MTRHFLMLFTCAIICVMTTPVAEMKSSNNQRTISFGTTLDPQTAINEARQLAASYAAPTSQQWQAKGDQRRVYYFPDADTEVPYRIRVPEAWNGTSELPLVMYLHGAGSDENMYLDMNNGQLIKLADEYGFLLVSPLGYEGAYGNFLRLTGPFGNPAGAEQLMAQVTESGERKNQLSEQDVLNVLELVMNEYPVDKSAVFLSGHSMGSGGTWYIGGKYADYWTALAPMSGPFVQETGYPWEIVGGIPVFITEGIQTPSLDASRLLRDWMKEKDYDMKYKEVDADHGGMIRLVLPDIFVFFDSCRSSGAVTATSPFPYVSGNQGYTIKYINPDVLRISVPTEKSYSTTAITTVKIMDISGRVRYSGRISPVSGEVLIHGIKMPSGTYYALLDRNGQNDLSTFIVTP